MTSLSIQLLGGGSQGRSLRLDQLFPIPLDPFPPAHVVVTGLVSAGAAALPALFSRIADTSRYLNPAHGYYDEITVEDRLARTLSFGVADDLRAAELRAESGAAIFAGALAAAEITVGIPDNAQLPVPTGDVFVISATTVSALAASTPQAADPADIMALDPASAAPPFQDGSEQPVQVHFSDSAAPSVDQFIAQTVPSPVTAENAQAPAATAIHAYEAPIFHRAAAIPDTGEIASPLMAAAFGPGAPSVTPNFQQQQQQNTTTTTGTATPAAAVDVSHIATDVGAEVVTGAKTIALSSLFTVTANSDNPTYLILSVLDRDDYTVSASGATGTLSGNGHTASLSTATADNDSRELGIVFTYNSSTGRYYNSTYGYFDALSYTASSSAGDITDLAVYATDSATVASKYASENAYLSELDSGGYVGTVTIATEASFTGSVPSQATPSSIVAIAESFVGEAWNMDGCWTLASTIAAEAGASLPVASSYVGTAGQAGGEWIVAYDGPESASSNWEADLKPGEFVVFETTSGSGHITLVVSGSGGSAELIDNITYENATGTIINSANDGSSDDVIIESAHAASQEFSGVSASTVVIYELDTPIVTSLVSADTLALKASQSLSVLFSITDPAGKSITEYQVYDTNSGDSLTVSGVTVSAHTAATAAEASSLSAISLVAGSSAGSDTVEIRAYNGSYWGDWDSVTVSVDGSTTSTVSASSGGSSTTTTTTTTTSSSVITVHATAAQTVADGTAYSYTLAANTFTDTAGLTYTTEAYQTSGNSAVSWLHYTTSTLTLHGTVPTGLTGSITLEIVATDTAGHTADDVFSLTFSNGAVSSVSVVGAASSGTEHIALG